MIISGFYIIKDEFFHNMNDPYLKGNKTESRPHYYCFQDTTQGIYWMIPMSSKIKKYQNLIDRRISAGQPCDILHIAKLDTGKECAFLIQDMFPVTEYYIQRTYTISGNHLKLTSTHTARIIRIKAKKVLGMLKRGVKFTPTQPDILSILKKLKKTGYYQ